MDHLPDHLISQSNTTSFFKKEKLRRKKIRIKRNSNNSDSQKKKYTFFWKINEDPNFLLKIELYLDDSVSASKAIEPILTNFKNKNLEENIGIKFDKITPHSVEIYFCKENGKIKKGLPALDENQVLTFSGFRNFAVCQKKVNTVSDSQKEDKLNAKVNSNEIIQSPISNNDTTIDDKNDSSGEKIKPSCYNNSLINMKQKLNESFEKNERVSDKACLGVCKKAGCWIF